MKSLEESEDGFDPKDPMINHNQLCHDSSHHEIQVHQNPSTIDNDDTEIGKHSTIVDLDQEVNIKRERGAVGGSSNHLERKKTKLLTHKSNEGIQISENQQEAHKQDDDLAQKIEGEEYKQVINRFSNNNKVDFKIYADDLRIIQERAVRVMCFMDEKMQDTLQKREYEIITGYKEVIARLLKDLSNIQQSKCRQNAMEQQDSKLTNMDKQLCFFREQAFELNNRLRVKESQFEQHLRLLEARDEEILTLKVALQNVTQKLIQIDIPKSDVLSKIKVHSKANTPSQNEDDSSSQKRQKQNLNKIKEKRPDQYPSIYSQQNRLSNETAFLTEHTQLENNALNSQNNGTGQLEFKLKQKNIIISSLQRQLNECQQSIANFSRRLIERNDLEQLFLAAVQDTQAHILKRSSTQNDGSSNEEELRMNSIDKVGLMQKFMGSQRFIEMVQAEIFNKKCCDNANCLFNTKIFHKSEPLSRNQRERDNKIFLLQNMQMDEMYSLVPIFSKWKDSPKKDQCPPSETQLSALLEKAKIKKSANYHVQQRDGFKNTSLQSNPNSTISTFSSPFDFTKNYPINRNRTHSNLNVQPYNIKDCTQTGFKPSTAPYIRSKSNLPITSNTDSTRVKKMNGQSQYQSQAREIGQPSLIIDEVYLREIQKNQLKIHSMNNQFKNFSKEEKIHNRNIDEKLSGFINNSIHKLSYAHKIPESSNMGPFPTPIFMNSLPTQVQSSSLTKKTRCDSPKVKYRHGKLYE